MKKGDLIRFKGTWADGNYLPRVGVVLNVMHHGVTKLPISADIWWSNGTAGNIMWKYLEVISESR